MTRTRLLWLGVEPTPYLLALQARARLDLPVELEIAFEHLDVSQPWGLVEARRHVLGGSLAKWRLLLRLLGRRYGALFIEGWGTVLLAGAGLAALAAGVPLIVSGDTWQETGRSSLLGLRRLVRRVLLRRAAATLPAGSRHKAFFAAEGARPDRVVIRRLTVDVEALVPRAVELVPGRAGVRKSFGLPPDVVVAATAARLVPGKGTAVLLQAIAVVPGLWLLVIGDGPERSALERCAVQLDVAARVVWTGRLPTEDMARAYAAADIFVLPSLAEGWGLAVNEAMACGLPVIVSSAVGCADDLIAGTGAGTIVPAGDVTALARAMAEFAGDTQGRQRAAARARAVIADWTLAAEIAAIRRAIEVALGT